jgi:hypothetical protein
MPEKIEVPVKPCDGCNENVLEAMEQGEITCHLKCEAFKHWQEKRSQHAEA